MIGVGWTIDTVNFCSGFIRMLFPFSVGMLLARTFKPRKVKGAFWICSLVLVDIYTLGDCWSVALLVIVSSIALAYI